MPDKRPVSLLKGQNPREDSLNGSCVESTAPPHKSHNGVSPDYAHTASSANSAEEAVWFLMRAAYGQERKARDFLETKGIETFLPTHRKCFVSHGKRILRSVSLIPNFLFVKSTEAEMKQYVGRGNLCFFHHYYVPDVSGVGCRSGHKRLKPLVIPHAQMEAFRKWYAVPDDNKLFVAGGEMAFGPKDRVRVVAGHFEGLSGYVCRIKGQSRVGVSIDGVGMIFTAYVPKGMLEKI